MSKKNPFANQRDPDMQRVTEFQSFTGVVGVKRIKAMQKLVRPLGYFIYVVDTTYNGARKRLEFWTTTGMPFNKVLDTLSLNKLWPPIPPEPKPRIKIKQESALDVFKRSLEEKASAQDA